MEKQPGDNNQRPEPDPDFFMPQMLNLRMMQQPWPRRPAGARPWWNRRVWKFPVWLLLVIGVAIAVALIELNTPDPADSGLGWATLSLAAIR